METKNETPNEVLPGVDKKHISGEEVPNEILPGMESERNTETGKKIIFVADHNENDRVLLNKALENLRLPFVVYYMHDGTELLKSLEKYYSENQSFPKMILLDYNIISSPTSPTGIQTLQMIKSHFLYKTIPVLILSAEQSDEIVVEAYNLGANSFIVKPATLKEFEDFVKMLNSYWFQLGAI